MKLTKKETLAKKETKRSQRKALSSLRRAAKEVKRTKRAYQRAVRPRHVSKPSPRSAKRLARKADTQAKQKGKKSGKGKNLRQAQHRLEKLEKRVGGARPRHVEHLKSKIVRFRHALDKKK